MDQVVVGCLPWVGTPVELLTRSPLRSSDTIVGLHSSSRGDLPECCTERPAAASTEEGGWLPACAPTGLFLAGSDLRTIGRQARQYGTRPATHKQRRALNVGCYNGTCGRYWLYICDSGHLPLWLCPVDQGWHITLPKASGLKCLPTVPEAVVVK